MVAAYIAQEKIWISWFSIEENSFSCLVLHERTSWLQRTILMYCWQLANLMWNHEISYIILVSKEKTRRTQKLMEDLWIYESMSLRGSEIEKSLTCVIMKSWWWWKDFGRMDLQSMWSHDITCLCFSRNNQLIGCKFIRLERSFENLWYLNRKLSQLPC